ncbi:MAG: hypothetical protein ACHQF2_09080 [Flavobacteriales bacterium]
MKILENTDVMGFRENFQSALKHVFATLFLVLFWLWKKEQKRKRVSAWGRLELA